MYEKQLRDTSSFLLEIKEETLEGTLQNLLGGYRENTTRY